MVNIRTKGASGEREVADMINEMYDEVLKHFGETYPDKAICQRNQNQTAVGGCDLINTCGYAIEVKRQENLQLNTWWQQCYNSAKECDKEPLLIYRQSRKSWRVVLFLNTPCISASQPCFKLRAEISLDEFKVFFKEHAKAYYNFNKSFK